MKNISHSDRLLYKRCRRKWDLSSSLRQGLGPRDAPVGPLWFGSAMHFAMEDFHGLRRFGDDPKEALKFFANATPQGERPSDAGELYELGKSILDYYQTWLAHRDVYKTVYIDGKPQVEVRFELPITLEVEPFMGALNESLYTDEGEAVQFVGVFDRIVQDVYGNYYVMDYKFVKKFDTSKLPLDPQVSAYCWAAEQLYGHKFDGMIYMQFRKEFPEPPMQLKNGTFSQAKSQATTYQLYRQALINVHGSVPPMYEAFLGWLSMNESADTGDAMIRRDVVRRNENQVKAENEKIWIEASEMTAFTIPVYPNPTRDCTWDCPFQDVCIGMDDGSDYQWTLANNFAPKKELDWRKQLAAAVEEHDAGT